MLSRPLVYLGALLGTASQWGSRLQAGVLQEKGAGVMGILHYVLVLVVALALQNAYQQDGKRK